MIKSKIILGLIFTYFLTRLPNLTIIPVFVDEAIYTRWSQVISSDSTQWAIPLSDGKQPLFMWIGALVQKITADPLLAERLVSVIAGFFTMILLYLLSKELLNHKVGIITMVLYILSPFSFFYDRLAVPDGLLTTFYLLIIFSAIKFIKHPNLKSSLFLGLALGGGMLTKSTAALALFVMPFAAVFFDWGKAKIKSRILELGLFGIIALGVAVLIYYSLKLSPLFYLIAQRTPDFIFTPKEVLIHPLDPLQFRVGEVTNWLKEYLTLPIFLLSLFGIATLAKKEWKKSLLLTAAFIVPLFIEMEIAKGFTPRYFTFVTPFALVLAAYSMSLFLKKVTPVRVSLAAIFLIPAAVFIYLLITDPYSAPIPQKEKQGYLEDWSAGYGIREISQYLKDQSKKGQPITVGTEGTQGYGTLPDGLQIYLRDTPSISVVGMGQRAEIYNVPEDLISDAKIHPSFLVVNENRLLDKLNPHLNLISSYPKANGLNPLLLYQITP
jgi:hypothetical protein